ncbi:hypothetical protein ACFLT9_13345 [Acidobacteriota bacterium]
MKISERQKITEKRKAGAAQLILFSLIFLTCFTSVYSIDLNLFGYYQNRLFLLVPKDLKIEDVGKRLLLGDYNRLRLQLQTNAGENVSVNFAIDLYTFHGIIRSPLGVYSDDGDSTDFLASLDRAYVDFYLPGFDITLGKQRIAFGVSRIWAPLDLFNRVNIFEPGEEKPGVTGIKAYVPIGSSSSLTAVFAPENDFNSYKSGARFQSLVGGVDIGISYIRYGLKKTDIFGLDLRGENFIGWWIEGGYFVSDIEDDLKIVLGFDYTFPVGAGLYWQSEFFYDASGQSDKSDYDLSDLLAGDRFTLGQKYFMSSLSLPLTQFLSSGLAYIGNWTDGSWILSPSLRYDLAESVTLNVGFFLPLGSDGGEFKREGASNIFYIWLTTNF